MKGLIIASVCFFTAICTINSQQPDKKLTISGTILDVYDTPIDQAIILVDGKEIDARSDVDGNYSVKVKKNARYIGVVVVGTGILEEEINGRTQIDFQYSREVADMPEFKDENVTKPGDELVNTGYGTIKKKYVTGTVGFLDVEHSNRKYISLTHILKETPGLLQLGEGVFVVAGTSLFSGYVPPLYVIDNMATDYIPSLHPSQIASVTVLKGGSAAIYGSRGFGGVIIITTKIP